MSPFVACLGYALLAAGPLLAVFCQFLAPKPFLVLLTLASAFYWLVTAILTSAVFRGAVPLGQHPLALFGALFLGTAVQEGARCGLWLIHRRAAAVLRGLARANAARLSFGAGDERLLALAHGVAHAAVQALFLYFSWLPLVLGGATYYVEACAHMSYFLTGALLCLAFSLLHAFSMVVAFEGLTTRRWQLWAIVPAAHALAALLTVVNTAGGGCLISVPLELALGLAMTGLAAHVCWEAAGPQGRRRGAVEARGGGGEPASAEEEAALRPEGAGAGEAEEGLREH